MPSWRGDLPYTEGAVGTQRHTPSETRLCTHRNASKALRSSNHYLGSFDPLRPTSDFAPTSSPNDELCNALFGGFVHAGLPSCNGTSPSLTHHDERCMQDDSLSLTNVSASAKTVARQLPAAARSLAHLSQCTRCWVAPSTELENTGKNKGKGVSPIVPTSSRPNGEQPQSLSQAAQACPIMPGPKAPGNRCTVQSPLFLWCTKAKGEEKVGSQGNASYTLGQTPDPPWPWPWISAHIVADTSAPCLRCHAMPAPPGWPTGPNMGHMLYALNCRVLLALGCVAVRCSAPLPQAAK